VLRGGPEEPDLPRHLSLYLSLSGVGVQAECGGATLSRTGYCRTKTEKASAILP